MQRELTGGKDKGVVSDTPESVARMFFEACGKEDWKTVDMLFPGLIQSGNADRIKEMLGGLKVKSIRNSIQIGSVSRSVRSLRDRFQIR